jgi:hypothetical protein
MVWYGDCSLLEYGPDQLKACVVPRLGYLLVLVCIAGHQVSNQAVDGIRDSITLTAVSHGCIVPNETWSWLPVIVLLCASFYRIMFCSLGMHCWCVLLDWTNSTKGRETRRDEGSRLDQSTVSPWRKPLNRPLTLATGRYLTAKT